MKKLLALVITVALLLTSASIAFADESTPVTHASVNLAIDGPIVTAPIQKNYIRDVLGVEFTDSTVISITDISLSTNGSPNAQGNAKAIKTTTPMDDGTMEVSITVPMIADANGNLTNAFASNPNYLATAATTYASGTTLSPYATGTSPTDGSIPDLTYRVVGYYNYEVISSHYVYRFTSAQFKWSRKDSSSPYKVNRFKLVAAVCGDLYNTSFELIEEDYEKSKTLDKSNPTVNTYYSTGTIMSSTGNAVTVGGYYQGASLDWDYWVYNSDGSNVHDIGSDKVFGP